MKKILVALTILLFGVSSAFAANFGLILVSANVTDGSEITVEGQTGSTDLFVEFTGISMATTETLASSFTNLSYSSNLATVKVTVTNVASDNSVAASVFPIDGLVNWGDLVAGATEAEVGVLPLAVYAQNDGGAAPAIGAGGWQTVYDSQRFNSFNDAGDRVAAVLAAPGGDTEAHVLVNDGSRSGSLDVYYKADFTAAAPGGYGAAIQYGYFVE